MRSADASSPGETGKVDLSAGNFMGFPTTQASGLRCREFLKTGAEYPVSPSFTHGVQAKSRVRTSCATGWGNRKLDLLVRLLRDQLMHSAMRN
jgi:hypothetical protein